VLNGKINEPGGAATVAHWATDRNLNQAGAAAVAFNGKPNQAGALHRKAAKAAASTDHGLMTFRWNAVKRFQGNRSKSETARNKWMKEGQSCMRRFGKTLKR
jgi:hypothetical protein